MLKNIFISILLLFVLSCNEKNSKYSERRIPQKNVIYIQDTSSQPSRDFYAEPVRPYSAPQKAKVENYKEDQVGFFGNLFKNDKPKEEVLVTDEVAAGDISGLKKQYESAELPKHVVYQNDELALQTDSEIRIVSEDGQQIVERPAPLQQEVREVVVSVPNDVVKNKVAPVVLDVPKVNKPEKQVSSSQKQELRYVQVGAFRSQKNALSLASSLEKYGNVSISPSQHKSGQLYLVRIGPLLSKTDALDTQTQMRNKGFKNAFITTK